MQVPTRGLLNVVAAPHLAVGSTYVALDPHLPRPRHDPVIPGRNLTFRSAFCHSLSLISCVRTSCVLVACRLSQIRCQQTPTAIGLWAAMAAPPAAPRPRPYSRSVICSVQTVGGERALPSKRVWLLITESSGVQNR